jgi:alanine racemase
MSEAAAVQIQTGYRPTVAVVDLGAVRHNVGVLKPPGAELMAVVKANGYGHGDVAVARAALDAGATWLGVAMAEEGLRLRDAGVTAPILVLSELPPGSEADALAARLSPTLYTDDGLAGLAGSARAGQDPVGVHLKLDTGMHRVGLSPGLAVGYAGRMIEAGLTVEGVWTHFAKAEEPGDPSVAAQLEAFLAAVDALEAAGIRPRYRHAANSAAIMTNPASHLDLVRLGVAMYGLPPAPGLAVGAEIRSALTWVTRVHMTKRVAAGEGISYGLHYRLERESTIVTLPLGYADGYPRIAGPRAWVLIRGRRYPVAGTICMDQITVDCGDDPVASGDEVVLIGRQGNEGITAAELAEWAGTINYEVVCGISARVPREYRGA